MLFNKAVTVKQIQELDRIAINTYGVPSLILMENAGRRAADEILKVLKKKKGRRACVFCGLGNNAGDGFVIARHLLNADIKTDIFLIGRPEQLKNDAAVNYRILKNCKYPVKEIHKIDKSLEKRLQKTDVIVDAIFGVGLNREILDPFESVIRIINQSRKPVISVDIPSGLDGTSGQIYGVCVKASKTVTFTLPKKGFFINQGPQYTGKIIVADIGIPKNLVRKIIRL